MIWLYGVTIVKLLLLFALWPLLAVIVHFIVRDSSSQSQLTLVLGAVAGIAGLYASDRILRWGGTVEQPFIRRKQKVEPETVRLRDMIALLDEDDLDDLRAELRESLRDRIRNLTADESESFEDLLADAGTKPKRGAR